MNLVAPVFLAGLALLVPVLIAFLVRRRRQIVRVPSTMIWRLGARSVAKNRRIRDVRRL
ncbi:MAG: BatA domain-containing protein, partial [Myxococcales bacterium]|nr:BatA domain-containing protein [Myxococcales bacterium]